MNHEKGNEKREKRGERKRQAEGYTYKTENLMINI